MLDLRRALILLHLISVPDDKKAALQVSRATTPGAESVPNNEPNTSNTDAPVARFNRLKGKKAARATNRGFENVQGDGSHNVGEARSLQKRDKKEAALIKSIISSGVKAAGIAAEPTAENTTPQTKPGSIHVAGIGTTNRSDDDESSAGGEDVLPPVAAEETAIKAELVTEPKIVSATQVSKFRRFGIPIISVTLILVLVTILATVLTRDDGGDNQEGPTGVTGTAFTSTEELYDAVDEYKRVVISSENPQAEEVSLKFGYPIGYWNVSLLTNFSRVFDPNRELPLDPNPQGKGKKEDRDPDIHTEAREKDVFRGVLFDQDIANWDVSNAVTMRGMVSDPCFCVVGVVVTDIHIDIFALTDHLHCTVRSLLLPIGSRRLVYRIGE